MAGSERDICVRLTGPQYSAILAALDLFMTTMDDEGYRQATQSGNVAARAADKIRGAWNRNETSGRG